MTQAQPVRYPTVLLPAAKEFIGRKVTNAQNEDLGKIEDLMIDSQTGRVAYAILSFGGFLGVGDKLFAIPLEALGFDPSRRTFLLNVDKEVLKNAPGFEKDNWPNMADTRWGAEVYRYYGYRPYWE